MEVKHTTIRNEKLFCSNCGGEHKLVFPIPMSELPEKITAFNNLHKDCENTWVEPSVDQNKSIEEKAIFWLAQGEHGLSSKAMWFKFMNQTGLSDHPHDPDDFSRCYKLLECVPEWKEKINTLRSLSPSWNNLVDNWDTLTRMYEENVSTYWKESERIGMYKFMRSILD